MAKYTNGKGIKHNRVVRTQEVVEVTRQDLREILEFDWYQTLCISIGSFLVSGTTFEIIKFYFGGVLKKETAFIFACMGLLGLLMLFIGFGARKIKRDKINGIFTESSFDD